jgi:hypothetical protein
VCAAAAHADAVSTADPPDQLSANHALISRQSSFCMLPYSTISNDAAEGVDLTFCSLACIGSDMITLRLTVKDEEKQRFVCLYGLRVGVSATCVPLSLITMQA